LDKIIGFESCPLAALLGMQYWPFVSDEVGAAVVELLNSPGVAKLGFCEDAICVTTDEEYRAGKLDVLDIFGTPATVLDEVSPDGADHASSQRNDVCVRPVR